jgi:hypothetical protein
MAGWPSNQLLGSNRTFIGPAAGHIVAAKKNVYFLLLAHILRQQFQHQWVNHRVNFVDPNDLLIHTQGIEASWKATKVTLNNCFFITIE